MCFLFKVFPLGLLFFTFHFHLEAQACVGITIKSKPLLSLPGCGRSDGSISMTKTEGGRPPYTYHLGNKKNTAGIFDSLKVGKYQLIIEDQNACKDSFHIKLLYKEISKIIVPNNAFTPNGDQMNDRWLISGIEGFVGATVQVYNRWGQMVYLNSQYSNKFGWDGTQNGNELPAATYYYVITAFNRCVEEYIKGTVTIIR